jgi:hypothetical protein
MKKSILPINLFIVVLLSIIAFSESCKTNAAIQQNKISKVQILINKTWQVDKLHHVINGEFSDYTRNGENNTGIKYNNLRFTFYADGTAIHIDENGKSYNATWKFTSSDMRTLAFTINGHTDTWEMVEISGKYLHASAHLIISGDPNNIETFRLVQIP